MTKANIVYIVEDVFFASKCFLYSFTDPKPLARASLTKAPLGVPPAFLVQMEHSHSPEQKGHFQAVSLNPTRFSHKRYFTSTRPGYYLNSIVLNWFFQSKIIFQKSFVVCLVPHLTVFMCLWSSRSNHTQGGVDGCRVTSKRLTRVRAHLTRVWLEETWEKDILIKLNPWELVHLDLDYWVHKWGHWFAH